MDECVKFGAFTPYFHNGFNNLQDYTADQPSSTIGLNVLFLFCRPYELFQRQV